MACSLSLKEHIESTMLALINGGPSAGCEKAYQALIELAELSRRLYNFSPYTAQLTDELVANAEEGKRILEEEMMNQMFEGKKVATA